MHRAIVFNGIAVFAISLLVFFLRGRQPRRELDEQMNMQQLSHIPLQQPGGNPPTTA
jgi:FLVCR family MFS transporter 7